MPGKTVLLDSLVTFAWIIAQEIADSCADEAECGITVKSTGVSLCYVMTEEPLKGWKGDEDGECLIKINPGHIAFSSEIIDGALMVVDFMEGVYIRAETMFCQALGEWELGEEDNQTFLPITENASLGYVQVQPENFLTFAISACRHAVAITNCDPEGPHMLHVSKMVSASDKGEFFAFARVFSGRVPTRMRVWIIGPNYVPGQKKDLDVKSVQHTVIWIDKKQESVDEVPLCINVVAGFALDLSTNTTLTNEEVDACPIKVMKFYVSSVVRVAAQCKADSDVLKLFEGFKRLAKSNPMVLLTIEEYAEHIAGAGELLEICLKDLQEDFMGCAEIIISSRKAVTESCLVVMSLNKGLAEATDESCIGHDDPKVWCFQPETTGLNMVADMCKGVQYLNEIKDCALAGLQWASKEGALAENMRCICFYVCDVLHADAIHRDGGQVSPMARRVIYASQLMAKPRLVEPVYLMEIQGPEYAFGGFYGYPTLRHHG